MNCPALTSAQVRELELVYLKDVAAARAAGLNAGDAHARAFEHVKRQGNAALAELRRQQHRDVPQHLPPHQGGKQ